ncbi:hypothetical protein ACFXPN_42485 [Streptomyces griseorubiginosus]|uniref:hypothetical protein n=1 Tax=Streptomyces griseorubiginosus TaxID=67304 RepID=UPI003697553E
MDDCAVCPFRQSRGPCGPDCTPEPWTLDHQVHLFAQTESRPGPLTDDGGRWMERQPTGKVHIVCQCGYASGLIDRTELESTVAGLAADHGPGPTGPPTNAQVTALD